MVSVVSSCYEFDACGNDNGDLTAKIKLVPQVVISQLGCGWSVTAAVTAHLCCLLCRYPQ